MSWQLVALNAWLRLRERPRLAREASVELARARMERMAALAPPPAGAGWRQAAVGVAARRMPGPDAGGVLLWFHGGAYCLGSSATHAAMVTALAERADAGAVVPDYRLAPEHPFPAAVEDARAAWDALVKEVPAERIGLGGDSAGGGLAFALLQELLAEGLAAPACVVAFSPWTDLTLAGRSLASQAWREVLLPPKRLEEIRNLYLAGADASDPRASPRHGRYRGRAAGADPGEPGGDPAGRRAGDGGDAAAGRGAGDARSEAGGAACLAGLSRAASGGRCGARPGGGFPAGAPQNGVIGSGLRNIRAAALVTLAGRRPRRGGRVEDG